MPNCDLVSDLHLDFYKNACELLENIQPTSQTLVIAGDLSEASSWNPRWAEILSGKYKRILYVLGNHEWYRQSFYIELGAYFKKMLAERGFNRWTVLDDDVFGDFKGTTLWFPDQPDNFVYEQKWSDFKWIKDLKDGVYHEHEAAKKFLMSAPACPVWITHHLPFWGSVHPKYEGDQSNRFYVGDLARDLWSLAPGLWPKVILHGHTHEQFDYDFAGIRVVANPFGYPHEGKAHIVPKLVGW